MGGINVKSTLKIQHSKISSVFQFRQDAALKKIEEIEPEFFDIADDVQPFSVGRCVADEFEDKAFFIKFPAGLDNGGSFHINQSGNL